MLALILAAAVVSGSDSQAALADRATFPAERQPFLFYVTTATNTDSERRDLEIALRLVVPSMSRQPVLERCTLRRVPNTRSCYRLDLADLQWPLEEWHKVIAKYPYNPAGGLPLILRADWLLVTLTDEREADAYYPLVFGKRPATRDEALQILGVSKDPIHQFGMIEGESGVSLQKERKISNFPILRGYAWGTEDYLKLDAKRDPYLALLPGEGQHDGEEWIIGIPKIYKRTGVRGALQVYFLANGDGGIVDVAPVTLVEDWTEFRGYREICNAGSCFTCHADGLNLPTVNVVRDSLVNGVKLKALYPQVDQIEAFHLSDLGKEIRRNNEDYQAIVKLCTGVSPNEATGCLKAAVNRYDEDVTLERAAREFYIQPEEAGLAFAWASRNNINLGPRPPLLAAGKAIPRDAFEENYRAWRAVIDQWRVAAPGVPQ